MILHNRDSIYWFAGILTVYVGGRTACLSFASTRYPVTVTYTIQLLLVLVCEDSSPRLCVWDDPPLSSSLTVIVSTEITDGQGSKVQPCTVAVTVLPRYHRNNCQDKDL